MSTMSFRIMNHGLFTLMFGSALIACSGPVQPPTTPNTATTKTDSGYELAMLTISCWFGGVWSDAQGIPPVEHRSADEMRCRNAVIQIHGKLESDRYLQLRAFEEFEVAKAVDRISTLAAANPMEAPQKEHIVSLFRAVAAAQRENMLARRAADKIKMDLSGNREPEKFTSDEIQAVEPLRAHDALKALLEAQVGSLTRDAHVLGIMSAMDRMEIARGLPKHLKIYAVEDAYFMLFGVPPRSVPPDPTTQLQPGVWLTYLTDVALRAGHPVPESAKTPVEQNQAAWGGVLTGFMDKLRADVDTISPLGIPTLRPIVEGIIKRIENERKSSSIPLS